MSRYHLSSALQQQSGKTNIDKKKKKKKKKKHMYVTVNNNSATAGTQSKFSVGIMDKKKTFLKYAFVEFA